MKNPYAGNVSVGKNRNYYISPEKELNCNLAYWWSHIEYKVVKQSCTLSCAVEIRDLNEETV